MCVLVARGKEEGRGSVGKWKVARYVGHVPPSLFAMIKYLLILIAHTLMNGTGNMFGTGVGHTHTHTKESTLGRTHTQLDDNRDNTIPFVCVCVCVCI